MASVVRNAGATSKLIAGFHGNGVVPSLGLVSSHPVVVTDPCATLKTNDSLRHFASKSVSSINSHKNIAVLSKRFAHTDVRFPNYDNYRVESTKDVNKAARESEDDRRGVTDAVVYGVGGMVTLLAARNVVQTMVHYKAMAADQRALASIEINVNQIPEGSTKTFEWRGKPVFVKHRTPAEIKRERSVNVTELRHPESDEERVQKEEWSVVIGVCTHLGCVPIAGAGDFGGYYCPCHGSHYDASGRIRKGPAPLNLTVPAYSFKGDVIVVGGN